MQDTRNFKDEDKRLQEVMNATLRKLKDLQFGEENMKILMDRIAAHGSHGKECERDTLENSINLGFMVSMFCDVIHDSLISENRAMNNKELIVCITTIANAMSHILTNMPGFKTFVPLDKRDDYGRPDATFILAGGADSSPTKAAMVHGDKNEIAYILHKMTIGDEQIKRRFDMLKLAEIFETNKEIPDDIKFSDEEKSLLVSIGSSSEDAFMAISGVVASNISDVRKMHAKLRSEFIDPIKIALAEIESAEREGLSMEEAEARAFKKLNAEKISPFMRAAFATDTIQ
jgi:hypothetical protein